MAARKRQNITEKNQLNRLIKIGSNRPASGLIKNRFKYGMTKIMLFFFIKNFILNFLFMWGQKKKRNFFALIL